MFDYYRKQFGYLIHTERVAQKLTYYELQKQSKVATSVIQAIENGTTNYTLESLVRVSEALGLKLSLSKK